MPGVSLAAQTLQNLSSPGGLCQRSCPPGKTGFVEQRLAGTHRTSDAIAIALRVKCDIYTTPEIVRECGVVLENSAEEKDKDDDSILALEPEEIHDETKLKKWLSLLDVDELSDRLDEAIADENYEYAKMYKDEIRRREEEGRSR